MPTMDHETKVQNEAMIWILVTISILFVLASWAFIRSQCFNIPWSTFWRTSWNPLILIFSWPYHLYSFAKWISGKWSGKTEQRRARNRDIEMGRVNHRVPTIGPDLNVVGGENASYFQPHVLRPGCCPTHAIQQARSQPIRHECPHRVTPPRVPDLRNPNVYGRGGKPLPNPLPSRNQTTDTPNMHPGTPQPGTLLPLSLPTAPGRRVEDPRAETPRYRSKAQVLPLANPKPVRPFEQASVLGGDNVGFDDKASVTAIRSLSVGSSRVGEVESEFGLYAGSDGEDGIGEDDDDDDGESMESSESMDSGEDLANGEIQVDGQYKADNILNISAPTEEDDTGSEVSSRSHINDDIESIADIVNMPSEESLADTYFALSTGSDSEEASLSEDGAENDTSSKSDADSFVGLPLEIVSPQLPEITFE